MIKIIRSGDPFFSVRNIPDRFYWEHPNPGENLEVLIQRMKKEKCLSVPYAEYLFSSESDGLKFIEENLKSVCDVHLYCRNLLLPEVVLRYSVISSDTEGYEVFSEDVKNLGFSESAASAIFNNIRGIPFSNVSGIINSCKSMDEKNAVDFVLETKRNLLRQNETLEVVHMQGAASDIGGLSVLKKWIVDRRDNFTDKARDYGIPVPKGMLMLGVQGCGKSLTAKVTANIWNFPLVRLDFVNLFKQGRSVEELIKEAVFIAEGFAPMVLWIDEIEKALSQESQSAEIQRVLGWLMTWMQEKTAPVFLVATANRVKMLPPELLRKGRFDEIFFVDLPSVQERLDIFRIHISKRDRDPEKYDIEKLANMADNFSGSEIEMCLVNAMISDFGKNRELSQKSIEESIRNTVPISVTYEENIKDLRIWSRNRARNASGNVRLESFFKK
ncbi:MAG: AAA family ATPase [bacterium]